MNEYVTSVFMLEKVDYVNTPPELSPVLLNKDISDEKYLASQYLELLYTKHISWSYEKEWRTIIKSSENKVQRFIPASKIIVGVNASTETIKRLEEIAKNKNIEVEYLELIINHIV